MNSLGGKGWEPAVILTTEGQKKVDKVAEILVARDNIHIMTFFLMGSVASSYRFSQPAMAAPALA